MTIQTVQLAPTGAFTAPHNGFSEWATVISAGVQNAGLAKTQLAGFDIYPRVSKCFQSPTNAGFSPYFMIPLAVQTNDFMLVSVTTVSGTTITTPSGWTLIRSDVATGGTGPVTQSLYYRYAAGTTGQTSTDAGTTVTFTLSNANTASFAGFVAYAGVALSSAVNVQGVASSSTNGTTATAGAQSTTVPNCYAVQCYGWDTATISTSSTPTGYYAEVSQTTQTTAIVGGSIFDKPLAASGAIGTPASTLTNTGSWIVQTIGLAPNTALFVPTLTQGSAGTLSSGTYAYRVSATNVQGETIPCAEVTTTFGGGSTNSVTVSWSQVVNATGYKVYGRTSGSELLMQTITSGSTLSWVDTGSVSPSGALNTVDTTSDSGQVAFGAVSSAIGAGAKGGYEIYQFTDSLQTTSPVFLRLDYGGGGGATTPGMWVTVGTSTNGSGTITANANFPNSITTANVIHSSSSAGNTTLLYNAYIDSDSGSSLMIVGPVFAPGCSTPTCSGFLGAFERTREWDGTPNGEGVVCTWGGPNVNTPVATYLVLLIANSALFQQPASTNGVLALSTPVGWVPSEVATIGTTVYTFPHGMAWTPKLNAPGKHFLQAFNGDIPAGATFTVTSYGSSHTYIRTCGGCTEIGAAICARIT